MKMKLRPHQEEMVDTIIGDIVFGGESGDIIMDACPAFGKTITALELARRLVDEQLVDKVFIMMNISELIDQFKITAKKQGIDVSILKSGYDYDEKSRIIIAMQQTVYSRLDKLSFDGSIAVIIDEVHIAYKTSRTMAIREAMKPDYYIGMSGTCFDHDGKELPNSYTIKTASAVDLLNKGLLSKLKPIQAKIGLDEDMLKGVSKSGAGEYNMEEMETVYLSRTNEMIDSYCNHDGSLFNPYHKSIVFCTTTNHADIVTEALQRNGIQAASYHSKSKNKKAIMESYKTGNPIKVERNLFSDIEEEPIVTTLVSIASLSVGFDAPDTINALFLFSSNRNNTFIQRCMRAGRIAEGKSHGVIIDFGQNIKVHKNPYEEYIPFKSNIDNKTIRELKSNYDMEFLSSYAEEKEEFFEVNRDDYNKWVDSIRNDRTPIGECDILTLKRRFAMSYNLFELTAIAIRFILLSYGEDNVVTDKGKVGYGYYANAYDTKLEKNVKRGYVNVYSEWTINFIIKEWLEAFENHPDNIRRWTKSFKTMARRIANNRESIYKLKNSINFLVEKEEDKKLIEADHKKLVIPDINIEDGEIPF